jgi:hypothetical protein
LTGRIRSGRINGADVTNRPLGYKTCVPHKSPVLRRVSRRFSACPAISAASA